MSKAAIAAIVIAVLLAASIPVIGIIAAVAIPSLLAARRASNESAAIGNLRTIGSAEATLYANQGRFGSIDDLVEQGGLDREWRDGMVRDGYRIDLVDFDDETFEITAEPETQSSGTRSFAISEDFEIRWSDGLNAPIGGSGKSLDED